MSAPTLHELNEHYAQELELFSIWMKNQGMSRSSESAYLSDVRQFLSLYYPAALESSSKLDIMRFLSRCREQGAGDEARNRKLSALRAFYKALNEMEMIAVNPAALTAKSKQQKNRLPVYLEEAQLRGLFSAIEGKYRYRNGTILLLMAYAGLRVGEIHRLNVEDLKPDRAIHVLGKGRKWRRVPLAAPVYEALVRSAERRPDPKQSSEQAMFVSQFGRRLSIRMIQTIADRTLEQLQRQEPSLALKKLSSHKLRHSFATMQIRNGTDIRTLQELMGHSSIETTQIYTHIDNQQLRDAIDSVASRIPAWE